METEEKIKELSLEVEKLKQELEKEREKSQDDILLYQHENSVWLCRPKDKSECHSICVYSNDTDPSDEESSEWSTYNYFNFEELDEAREFHQSYFQGP